MSDAPVTVPVAHVMWFVDHALDQMAVILCDLGNERANQRPALEGANSPYAILTHCLGVMEFWGGFTVAEREISRDRAAEFVAEGDVAALVSRAAEARRRLAADLDGFESMAQPRSNGDQLRPYDETKGSVVLHILEELYQHLGQMELTRDLLVLP